MLNGSTIIGHERALEVLSRMNSAGTLPHALLFVGPESVGKTTVAHGLIRQVLDYQGDLATHPDVHVLERLVDKKTEKKKTKISVAQVRELTTSVSKTAMIAPLKVVFIEEARTLSPGAANALLKTLEEPKGEALFILRASSADQLPATIVSRCQVLRFQPVARETILPGLTKMGFSPKDAEIASARSLGRPGRAIRYLKDSVYQSELETGIAQARTFLSQTLPERLGSVLQLIPKNEVHKKERLLVLLDQWELVFRDLLLRTYSCDDVGAQSLGVDDSSTQMYTSKTLVRLLENISKIRSDLERNVNPHLALEHLSLATHI